MCGLVGVQELGQYKESVNSFCVILHIIYPRKDNMCMNNNTFQIIDPSTS